MLALNINEGKNSASAASAAGALYATLWVVLLAGTGLMAPGESRAQDNGGIQTSVAVDVVGTAGNSLSGDSGKLQVREAEVIFLAPIDQTFDGLLNFAAHQEQDGAFFEIHEAYVGSSRLIPRSRFRLGQFFLGIGRLNRFHRHDWPFVSAPKVQSDFFDEEGIVDSGLEYSWLLPSDFFLDLTLGVTNGWTFGHTHNQGERPKIPTHYARLETYLGLPSNGGMQLGVNYLGRTRADETKQAYLGLDLTAKWRQARRLSFLLQSEVWHRWLSPLGSETEKTLGLYVYPQVALSDAWYIGLRGDWFTVMSLQDAGGAGLTNGTLAAVPTLSWKPSEFSTFRAAYTGQSDYVDGASTVVHHTLELQATFIIGAHPAHDF